MGGGLSGLTAAINLTQAGYNVDVFEKKDDCGARFHGDLEGLENWTSQTDVTNELKSMNIKINFDFKPFKKMYISDGEKLIECTSKTKKPVFYLVRRGVVRNSLDQGLKNQALDEGVNIHFNAKAKKEDMDVISIGPAENKPVGVAKGVHFETETDDIAVALLNSEASHLGYCYLLINKGFGCICSVNMIPMKHNVNDYFKKTYKIFNQLLDIDIKNPGDFSGVGCFLIQPRLIEENKIYTGEAAGLQDFLWGFGMRYAMISGFLAATSIIEDKDYKKLIENQILGRVKTSLVNRFLLERLGNYYPIFLIKHGEKNRHWWKEALYSVTNPSLHSRILYPFAKLNFVVKFML